MPRAVNDDDDDALPPQPPIAGDDDDADDPPTQRGNGDDEDAAAVLPIDLGAVEIRLDPEMSWPDEMDGEDGMWAKSARRDFDAARLAFAKYRTVRATNEANQLLTPEGQLAATREWVEKALPDLQKRLAAVRQEQHDLETKSIPQLIEKALPRSGDPEEIAQASEIRAILRALPETDRITRLEFLIRQGDTAALRAVVTAPLFLTGLDEADVAPLRMDAARKGDPERFARIEKLLKANKATERALDGVVRYFAYDTSPEGVRDRPDFVGAGSRPPPPAPRPSPHAKLARETSERVMFEGRKAG